MKLLLGFLSMVGGIFLGTVLNPYFCGTSPEGCKGGAFLFISILIGMLIMIAIQWFERCADCNKGLIKLKHRYGTYNQHVCKKCHHIFWTKKKKI